MFAVYKRPPPKWKWWKLLLLFFETWVKGCSLIRTRIFILNYQHQQKFLVHGWFSFVLLRIMRTVLWSGLMCGLQHHICLKDIVFSIVIIWIALVGSLVQLLREVLVVYTKSIDYRSLTLLIVQHRTKIYFFVVVSLYLIKCKWCSKTTIFHY